MNPRQQRFCQEYLVDLNASRAATHAGYSSKTASSQGERLLRNVEVRAEIKRLQQQRSEQLEITADDVLTDLAAIAFTPITEVLTIADGKVTLLDSSQWSDEASKAVESVRQSKDGFSVKMHSKLAALEKLMQHLGMLSDLNVAIATLLTYGDVQKTDEGYRVILNE